MNRRLTVRGIMQALVVIISKYLEKLNVFRQGSM